MYTKRVNHMRNSQAFCAMISIILLATSEAFLTLEKYVRFCFFPPHSSQHTYYTVSLAYVATGDFYNIRLPLVFEYWIPAYEQ